MVLSEPNPNVALMFNGHKPNPLNSLLILNNALPFQNLYDKNTLENYCRGKNV